MKVTISLPTYNESAGIVSLINDILYNFERVGVEAEAIVVDDNSPDGTGELVKRTFAHDPRVRCIIRTEERGLATAIKRSIKESTGDYILLMDADGNHDPKYIPVFLVLTPFYDAICGSRFCWGGGMKEGGWFRYWGSFYYGLFVRVVLGLRSQDNTSGYMLFRKNMINNLDLDKIFQGYGEYFFIFLYHFKKKGYSFTEIPIVYSVRRGGKSKTKFLEFLINYIWTAFKLRIGVLKIYKNNDTENDYKNTFNLSA